SGATPGILQPGEHMQVPVYFAGLLQPWDFSDGSVNFELDVLRTDNSDPMDWTVIRESRPTSITPAAWDVIWAHLQTQGGSCWGDYVRMLDDNASYLGRLGEHVVDVGDLWSFEIQQAIGFSPLGGLGGQTDLVVPAPGISISFSQVFSPNVTGRQDLGPLG